MSKIYSSEKIIFSENFPTLEELNSFVWLSGERKFVEFYHNKPISVSVVDIDNTSQLSESLKNFADGHPMAIDLEWKPDRSSDSFNPISLFQLSSSNGVLIILNSQNILNNNSCDLLPADYQKICPDGLSILEEFLSTHSFYGKGMFFDQRKLAQLFTKSFQFEDIEATRLKPHQLTLTFSKLVAELIGVPDAPFKDKNVTISNWNNRPLTVQQVLYAAFDAYATRLIWNYFIKEYNEDEIILDAPQIPKKKSKSVKTKKVKKEMNSDYNNKFFKPKFKLKVSFHSIDDFLYLLYGEDEDFGEQFNDIKKDSENYVKTGVYPTGYNPHKSLKRRFLLLEEIKKLTDEGENGDYFCNLCNKKIDASSLDDHIWECHFDQLPYVYFPDQSPKYIEKCLRMISYACDNFKIDDQQSNNKKNCTNENHNNDNINNEDDNDSEKNENDDDVCDNEDSSSESNDDDTTTNENGTNNENRNDNNNNNNNDNDTDDTTDSNKNVNNNETENSTNKALCTLCDHDFQSFSVFFAHFQHFHTKLPEIPFDKSIKEIFFEYMTKNQLYNIENQFCTLCDISVPNESSINHCWTNHGDQIVEMLKHRPNNYSDECFKESFPFGVKCICQISAGMMFKGSIACGFCKIGFDDPGELFVHLFHRHTRLIAVKKSDLVKWPLKARDLHIEFQNVLKKWCYDSAIDALSDESVKILQIAESENRKARLMKKKQKQADEKSTEKKEKKRQKRKECSYKCTECNSEILASPNQIWDHIIENHLIIAFDFIE